MSPLSTLDLMTESVSHVLGQCQCWLVVAAFGAVLALFIAAGVVSLQLMETLDRNDAGSALRG